MSYGCIFVADCPACGAVGARMYVCYEDVWCSRCHIEVGGERRMHGLDPCARAADANR